MILREESEPSTALAERAGEPLPSPARPERVAELAAALASEKAAHGRARREHGEAHELLRRCEA
ncbi:MAG: hypothetical protein L0206_25285, partial [Actinobacteria bacterium]|nr:hypothetical protein [Actinomycetota bacterium]